MAHTEPQRISVEVTRWHDIIDKFGPIGYVAETRVGYFACNFDRVMIAGACDSLADAEAIVRECEEASTQYHAVFAGSDHGSA